MFRKKLIIVEDDEIVAEDEGCGVGADSEYMRHHVLTQRPQATLNKSRKDKVCSFQSSDWRPNWF